MTSSERESGRINPVSAPEKALKSKTGQYGFIPAETSGRRKMRYVESSEQANACKLCK